MNERTALITGGTDGIGKAAAGRLLADGWKVVIVGRDAAHCEATVAELGAASGSGAISAVTADLSLLGDARRASDAFLAANGRLDFLFLNANAIAQERRITAEGFEWHLALVHLSRALMARRLESVLAGVASSHVLTVVGHGAEPLDEADLNVEHGDVRGLKALGRAQWATQMFTHAFNARSRAGMSIYMPGLVRTKILDGEPEPQRSRMAEMYRTGSIGVDQAAENIAAVVDELGRSGDRDAYILMDKAVANPLATPAGAPDRVWELTDRILAPYL